LQNGTAALAAPSAREGSADAETSDAPEWIGEKNAET
jgi:hypothetical protein